MNRGTEIWTSSRGRRLIQSLLVCLAPVVCFGELHWEKRQIQITAKPGDEQEVAVFRFTNTSKTPVTIVSLDTSCHCTVAEVAKRTYGPGESGEIKAVFTVGDRLGVQEKIVHVTTDSAPTEPIDLLLRVTIPETLSYSPRLLVWRLTEPPVDQLVMVANSGPQPITSIKFEGDPSGQAKVKIEAIVPGWKYQIAIQRPSLAKTTNMPYSLVAKFADNSTRAFIIYASVR